MSILLLFVYVAPLACIACGVTYAAENRLPIAIGLIAIGIIWQSVLLVAAQKQTK